MVMDANEYFRYASHEGLKERMAHLYPDAAKREAEMPRYVERLEFELTTILKMGFPGYFLIVGDFINWAKNNGCPVGPGRGSGAGSLVAYALKIGHSFLEHLIRLGEIAFFQLTHKAGDIHMDRAPGCTSGRFFVDAALRCLEQFAVIHNTSCGQNPDRFCPQ